MTQSLIKKFHNHIDHEQFYFSHLTELQSDTFHYRLQLQQKFDKSQWHHMSHNK